MLGREAPGQTELRAAYPVPHHVHSLHPVEQRSGEFIQVN